MSEEIDGDITVLLEATKGGSPGAADRLMALVYEHLKDIARGRVRVSGNGPVDATTLVHEAYLRLFGGSVGTWKDREHFFRAAARAMRSILIDRARRENAIKRGGGRKLVPLYDDLPQPDSPEDLLVIDELVKKLEAAHPDVAEVVILRYYGGLSREQLAEITGRSEGAIWRDWVFARAWLLAELEGARRSRD